MAIANDLTPLEILGVAIKSEIEAANLYRHIVSQVVNLDLKERLGFLVREEEKHRRILETAYRHQFPEVPLALPAQSLVPTIAARVQEGAALPELFHLAMEAEQMSEQFYAEQAGRAQEENARTSLMYLSRMEHGHYELLRTELEMIERFPTYYQVEVFDIGQEMVHLGP